MKATFISLENTNDFSILKTVGKEIREGKLVVFPTETVYGLGTNGLDGNAVKKIYEAKGRTSDNPLILHISDLEMLSQIAKNITEIEQKLITSFFPGPFTLILEKTELVPNEVTAGLDTVAIRMPSNKIARELIRYSGVPIAAPSANISGKPSGTMLQDIMEELGNKVDYLIDGGKCDIGLESTVVHVIDEIPVILRPGKITKEELFEVANASVIDKNVFSLCPLSEKPLSPGMRYKHYAPLKPCRLIYSKDSTKMIAKINELIHHYNGHILVISCTEHKNNYDTSYVLDIGSKYDFEEISNNMFSILRKVDTFPVDLVLIEGVSKNGLGLAIMNRLLRACEYDYLEL